MTNNTCIIFDPNFKSTITDNNDITELKELVHTQNFKNGRPRTTRAPRSNLPCSSENN